MYIKLSISVYTQMYIYTYTYIYKYVCIHTYILTYIPTNAYLYILKYIQLYIHEYDIHIRVHVYAWKYICTFVNLWTVTHDRRNMAHHTRFLSSRDKTRRPLHHLWRGVDITGVLVCYVDICIFRYVHM